MLSYHNHITNNELMKRAGMEDLSNIVRVRRLAGHILRLPPDRPASVAMQWEPDGGRRRTEQRTSKKDLATNIAGRFTGDAIEYGVVFAEWPVIGVGGKVYRRPMLQQELEDLSLSKSKTENIINLPCTVSAMWPIRPIGLVFALPIFNVLVNGERT